MLLRGVQRNKVKRWCAENTQKNCMFRCNSSNCRRRRRQMERKLNGKKWITQRCYESTRTSENIKLNLTYDFHFCYFLRWLLSESFCHAFDIEYENDARNKCAILEQTSETSIFFAFSMSKMKKMFELSFCASSKRSDKNRWCEKCINKKRFSLLVLSSFFYHRFLRVALVIIL